MIGIAYLFSVVVTISNQYACGAVAVAHRAAELLGYEVIDSQLPVIVEKGRSLGSRLLEGLERVTPEVASAGVVESHSEIFVRAVEDAVRQFSAEGNVVIVGRGAGAILGRRSDVLRVFMHAPREWRIERARSEFGLDEVNVSAQLDRMDKARKAYLRDWYGIEFGANTDLSIDTSTFGIEGSAALIVAAVNSRT